MTTLISTQGIALAATECSNDGVGVGGVGVGAREGCSRSTEIDNFSDK